MITMQIQNNYYTTTTTGKHKLRIIAPSFYQHMQALGLISGTHYAVELVFSCKLVRSTTGIFFKEADYITVTFQNRNHALLFKLSMDDCVEI